VKIKTSSNNNPKENGELGTGTKRSFSFHGVELGNKTAKKISRSKTLDFFCFLFLDGEHKAERATHKEQWRAQIEQRNIKMELKIGQHKQDLKHDFFIGVQQVYNHNQFMEFTAFPPSYD
jgi:hypothetical protein